MTDTSQTQHLASRVTPVKPKAKARRNKQPEQAQQGEAIVPATREAQGVDHLSPGAQDQPEQHGKTLSQTQKQQKEIY